MTKTECPMRDRVAEAYERLGGNISAVSRELGIVRSVVRHHLKKLGKHSKPLAGGTLLGVQERTESLPKPGTIRRYILTSAQNNTHVNEPVWNNLVALAKHYKATLFVGTYSYNQNAYGKLSVKRGTKQAKDTDLWYDDRLSDHFCDHRVELANGLVWCGEMNILPTAIDPLEGLETYSSRKSAIFPHAKLALRSIATMKGEGTKLNYTTGTVTQMNYTQKKAGLKAEHHHNYGGLLVEVDSAGHWWVRQLDADSKGRIFDLDLAVEDGKVTSGNRLEAITWGDLHAACVDPVVQQLSIQLLETLKPRYQFLHDILEGVSVNHHGMKDCHDRFRAYVRGYTSVERELKQTAAVVDEYLRDWVKTVVVDSNHDGAWLNRWLKESDYRRDPVNAVLFLSLQAEVYAAIENNDASFNVLRTAFEKFTPLKGQIQFLNTDESFKTCNGQIENGMHGHLGADGRRGSPANLNKIGRRANTGHTHSTGIWNGLYVAGTSSNLDMGYNIGPSSWTHSHILTYANGKRTIVTVYAGKWRA